METPRIVISFYCHVEADNYLQCLKQLGWFYYKRGKYIQVRLKIKVLKIFFTSMYFCLTYHLKYLLSLFYFQEPHGNEMSIYCLLKESLFHVKLFLLDFSLKILYVVT